MSVHPQQCRARVSHLNLGKLLGISHESEDTAPRDCFEKSTSPMNPSECSRRQYPPIGTTETRFGDSAIASLQIQDQPRRVFQALLHPHQERHRLAAVDDAVV